MPPPSSSSPPGVSTSPHSPPPPHKALMVGISGCSSSGKTTLSRLLRDLFPYAFILHEDDFYHAESKLPVRQPSGLLDWDCPEAIDVPKFAEALAYIRARGELPVSLRHGENESRTNHGIMVEDVRYLPERLALLPLPENVDFSRSGGGGGDSVALEGVTLEEGATMKQTQSESNEDVDEDEEDEISYFTQNTHITAGDFSPSPSTSDSTLTTPTLSSTFSFPSSPSTNVPTPLTPAPPPQQPTLESKEDLNTVGVIPVRKSVLNTTHSRVQTWLASLPVEKQIPKICITDGFLLYTPALGPVPRHLDLRLFLLVSRQKATERRKARDGYVTLEGFWKDPPGYVDQIVWPNYANSHAWMFVDGDAEKGILDATKLEKEGITAQTDKGMDVEMEITLEWAVTQVMNAVEKFIGLRK